MQTSPSPGSSRTSKPWLQSSSNCGHDLSRNAVIHQLYLPKSSGGLHLTSISSIFKKTMQVWPGCLPDVHTLRTPSCTSLPFAIFLHDCISSLLVASAKSRPVYCSVTGLGDQSINQSILNWTSESPAVGVVRSIKVRTLKNFKRCGEGSYIYIYSDVYCFTEGYYTVTEGYYTVTSSIYFTSLASSLQVDVS